MGTPPNLEGATNAAPADWTIMLYIAADNTLANFAVESLKQLKRSASVPRGKEDKARVAIVAQFSIDAPGGGQPVPRYYFPAPPYETGAPSEQTVPGYTSPASAGETLKESNPEENRLKKNSVAPIKREITDQEALADFLNWAYETSKSDHYALILWSHGPQLFLQPPPSNKTGDSASLYLTPGDLRDALVKFNEHRANRKLEIVGFDACSMSMFEMAYEINDLANLMIASQEEVPDASFPYSDMVRLFRQQGKDLGLLLDRLDPNDGAKQLDSPPNEALAKSLQDAHAGLKKGVGDYLDAYQDYIVGKPTGMNPVTLSVLNLAKCNELRAAVGRLACELLQAKDDPELPRRLIQARKNSQDYAGGLYVDLFEFCKNLEEQVNKTEQLDKAKGFDEAEWTVRRNDIKEACREVQHLLEFPDSSTSTSASSTSTPVSPVSIPTSLILVNGVVTETGTTLMNQNNTTANHGISIYLPYLTDRQFDGKVNRPLVKGGPGTNGGKGIPTALNVAAAAYVVIALNHLILDTESYYEDLKLTTDTAWYGFITDQWTKAIADTDPDPGFHYSDRQIQINLRRNPFKFPGPCSKYGNLQNRPLKGAR